MRDKLKKSLCSDASGLYDFEVLCLGIEDNRISAEEMDERRKENIAYVYLCHLEEAKMYVPVGYTSLIF